MSAISKQDSISVRSKIICTNCNKSNSQINNTNIITDPETSELICSNCGLVISTERVQESRPEWHYFDHGSPNNYRIRTGMPTSLARHDMGLSTIIGRTDRDYTGNRITTSVKSSIDKLRILDYRTQLYSATDRGLKKAFSELDILRDKLALPDSVVEKTAYIYRKAQQRGMIRGRTVSAMLAAAIYIACREIRIGKTLKDIAEGSNVKEKILSQSYRILLTELDIKTPMLDPMRCVTKIASKMKLNERITRQALSIMYEALKKEAATGKDPMGLASAVLYMAYATNNIRGSDISRKRIDANNENPGNRSQTSFAQAAGVTDVTLRHTIKDLKGRLVLLN
ncbi:MAG TPA: transcription initiation factor IIB [Nitrososphaeraceae archaeon]|nr:transcription initiation factor IIB [Nitrososphaeraceae archaeon]